MATSYIMQFHTEQNEPVSCLIWDNLTYDEPDTKYIDITGTGSPLTLKVIDNNEDKFTPIKALQLEISFLSTSQVNLKTFAEGDDNRFFVEVIYGHVPQFHIFKGFLVMDDISQPFLCDPNEVTLTATDGLGLLKDVPLTDHAGINPKGVYRIIDYLSFCLAKTGLQLNINSIFNLRNQSNQHFLTHSFLDAKTFEDEIGTSVNCYEALEMILGENAYLTQIFGDWWIVRVAEHLDEENTVYSFTYDGTGIDPVVTQARTFIINGAFEAFFSEESQEVKYIRPVKSVKEVFSYEYPKEIINNIDFSRGGIFFPLISDVDEADLIEEDQSVDSGFNIADWSATPFRFEDWTPGNNAANPNDPPTTTIYTKRIYYGGVEYERYLNIVGLYPTFNNYVRSNPVPVDAKAKFTFSVDYKFNRNISLAGQTTDSLAAIKLVGDNGTTYWLHDSGNWKVIFNRFAQDWKTADLDERQWRTITVTAKPLPVNGHITIYLLQSDIFPYIDPLTPLETRFKNIKFDYEPYINNSYIKRSNQYNKIEQGGNYKAKIDNDVFISDSPVRLFKGSLLEPLNDGYQLTTMWYNYAETPIPENFHPFGWWQAYGVWQQNNRLLRSFEFTCQGLRSNDHFPTLLHRFLIGDNSVHTNEKKFMLLHFEMDIRLCEWSGVLAEVMDTRLEKDYTTPIEFKYTEDR